MKYEKVLVWHFVMDNGRTQYGNILVEPGKTYSIQGRTILCKQGFHGSELLLDALKYAPGAMLYRSELWGNIERGSDKIVAQNRHELWGLDTTRLLHDFACGAAWDAVLDVARAATRDTTRDATWVELNARLESLVLAAHKKSLLTK